MKPFLCRGHLLFVATALTTTIAIACSDESAPAPTDAGTVADTSTSDSGVLDTATTSDTGAGVSTNCTAFPVTVTLGSSISPSTTGAVLCNNDVKATCRLTTNTYSDGPEPCPASDVMLVFLADAGSFYVNAGPNWTFESTSAGNLFSANKTIKDIPVSTQVTAIVADGTAKRKVVFQFNGGTSFTATSFSTT